MKAKLRWKQARKLFMQYGNNTKLTTQDFFNDPSKSVKRAKISIAARKRWSDAAEITRTLEMQNKDVNKFDVYKDIKKFRSKAKPLEDQLKKVKSKKGKTPKREQFGRPYFTYNETIDGDNVYFWKNKKSVHENEQDTKGFHYRFIDLYRWQKYLLPELQKRARNKNPDTINVYGIVKLKVTEMSDHEYFEGVELTLDDEMVLTFFAGDFNSFDEGHFKLLNKARKGSKQYKEIVEIWKEFYDQMLMEAIELIEVRGLVLESFVFEGFAVNYFDVGQDQVRY